METLVIGTYNISVAAVKKRPEQIKRDLRRLIETCHVVGLQEAGEAKSIIRWAKENLPVYINDGTGGKGEDATPIMYRKSLKRAKERTFPLTPATRVGPAGAGPSVLKPKFINVVGFRFNGRRVWVGNIHTAPSIYIPIRYRLQKKQFIRSREHMSKLRGIKFVCGDMNSVSKHPIRKNLYGDVFVSSQLKFGRIGTHGNRDIDDIVYLNDIRRVIPLGHTSIKGASDHDAYLAEFEIRPRVPLTPTD